MGAICKSKSKNESKIGAVFSGAKNHIDKYIDKTIIKKYHFENACFFLLSFFLSAISTLTYRIPTRKTVIRAVIMAITKALRFLKIAKRLPSAFASIGD